MSELPKEVVTLVQVSAQLGHAWETATPEERNKLWWEVHKASRAVWNLRFIHSRSLTVEINS